MRIAEFKNWSGGTVDNKLQVFPLRLDCFMSLRGGYKPTKQSVLKHVFLTGYWNEIAAPFGLAMDRWGIVLNI